MQVSISFCMSFSQNHSLKAWAFACLCPTPKRWPGVTPDVAPMPAPMLLSFSSHSLRVLIQGSDVAINTLLGAWQRGHYIDPVIKLLGQKEWLRKAILPHLSATAGPGLSPTLAAWAPAPLLSWSCCLLCCCCAAGASSSLCTAHSLPASPACTGPSPALLSPPETSHKNVWGCVQGIYL